MTIISGKLITLSKFHILKKIELPDSDSNMAMLASSAFIKLNWSTRIFMLNFIPDSQLFSVWKVSLLLIQEKKMKQVYAQTAEERYEKLLVRKNEA